MKTKLITLLLCTAIAFASFASDSTAVTSLTKEKIYEDAKSALKQLASALEVGAEHVYEVLVRQQVVYSIVHITLYVFISIAIFILFYQGNNLIKINKSNNHDDAIGWLMIPGGILSIALIIYFFCTISTTVTGFVNPEYGAIKEVMEIIK